MHGNMPVAIEVKDEAFGKHVAWITRKPVDRSGYQVVRYKGRYHQLHGGIRTYYTIYTIGGYAKA